MKQAAVRFNSYVIKPPTPRCLVRVSFLSDFLATLRDTFFDSCFVLFSPLFFSRPFSPPFLFSIPLLFIYVLFGHVTIMTL